MKQFLLVGALLTSLTANPAPYGDPQMIMRRQQQPQQQPQQQLAPPNPGNGDDATDRGFWGYPHYGYPHYWGGYPYWGHHYPTYPTYPTYSTYPTYPTYPVRPYGKSEDGKDQ